MPDSFLPSNTVPLAAGFAQADITPPLGIRLSGSMEKRVARTIRDRLAVRAIVLEQGSQRVALVGADLIGFDEEFADRLQASAREVLGINHVLFNGSHTHSAPDFKEPIVSEPWTKTDDRLRNAYFRRLERILMNVLREACEQTVPALMEHGEDRCDFGINRRLKVDGVFVMRPNPDGYRDPRVTVLRFRSLEGRGRLLGMLFSYACHPTTSYADFCSGDFPAAARRALERRWRRPALFLQGASAEIRPAVIKTVRGQGAFFRPGTARDVHRFGNELASAVSRVLSRRMRPLAPHLGSAESAISLSLTRAPRRAEIARMREAEPEPMKKLWWERLWTGNVPRSLPFRSWLLRLSDDFWILGAQHELCAGYVPLLEQLASGRRVLLLGYTNGFAGYVPTSAILQEGGYEGEGSAAVFGWPGPLTASVETKILNSWSRLFRRLAR